MAMDLITKQDGTTLHYSTMGQGISCHTRAYRF